MEFQEVVRRRRMIRSYRSDPVPEDAVERIVSTVLRGPTGGFAQGIDVIIITKPEMRQRVVESLYDEPEPNSPILAAPVLRQFISYKAQLSGVSVVFVDPAYTGDATLLGIRNAVIANARLSFVVSCVDILLMLIAMPRSISRGLPSDRLLSRRQLRLSCQRQAQVL